MCIVICGMILMFGALYVYDQSFQSIWERAIFWFNLSDMPVRYAYLPDYYYDQIYFPLPYSYHDVKSVDDFEVWRNTLVGGDGIKGVLHHWEDRPTVSDIPVDIEVDVVEIHDRQDYTLTKFTTKSFFDPDTVIFYEIIPDNLNSDNEESHNNVIYDAVFILPGSGHTGALDVLGEDGPWISHYYHDDIAQTIARAGYAAYVIELRGYGERAIDVGSACPASDLRCSSVLVEQKLETLGISMNDLRVDEITQVLAWIETRSYIDNIAISGLSLGGALALDQAIVNSDVIDAVIIASGVASAIHSPLGMNGGHNMTRCCDVSDYTVAIAPIPTYISYGSKDPETIWEVETGHTSSLMADAYKLHGLPENFWYVVHDDGHAYDAKSVLKFLEKHIDN